MTRDNNDQPDLILGPEWDRPGDAPIAEQLVKDGIGCGDGEQPLSFICHECYGIFPHDPKDPASGGLCARCAQKAYDNAPAVPLSEERIKEIVDFATGKCPWPGQPSHGPAVDRLAVTKRHDGVILVPHFEGGWLTANEARTLALRLWLAAEPQADGLCPSCGRAV